MSATLLMDNPPADSLGLGLDLDLNTHHAAAPGAAWQLRVLQGPQQGAQAPLPAGQAVQLAMQAAGLAADADIQLRDAQAGTLRLAITAQPDAALLQVLEGELELDGQRVTRGQTVRWACGQPITLGSTVIACGPADQADWTAEGQAAELAAAAPVQPSEASPAPRRRPELWLATAGAVLLLGCAGAWALAQLAVKPPLVQRADAASLGSALKASEFAALELQAPPGGAMQLQGRLATLAQRGRLDAWLAARGAAPAQGVVIDVVVDEALVREVSEVFRINGVPVQAQVEAPGQVLAQASEPDAQRLARAEEVVRRDVHGLAGLLVRNTARPAPPPAPPVAVEPGKRIASLVPGDPAYVVTADGARYFVGALLPSGHRITEVQAQQLTLERDGQPSVLNF
jgi:type III secretion protein D